MTTQELADKLVGRCRQGKFPDAVKELYGPDIVSVEAAPGPDGLREAKGDYRWQKRAVVRESRRP